MPVHSKLDYVWTITILLLSFIVYSPEHNEIIFLNINLCNIFSNESPSEKYYSWTWSGVTTENFFGDIHKQLWNKKNLNITASFYSSFTTAENELPVRNKRTTKSDRLQPGKNLPFCTSLQCLPIPTILQITAFIRSTNNQWERSTMPNEN